jgi:glycosyltransferase involved in cell wall biosynthesis
LEDFRPYTFLTFADRGFRKGWDEVREAFYLAFGGKSTGNQEVRLIIKSRENNLSPVLRMMEQAEGADKRIVIDISDANDMRDVFAQVNCLVLPSRSEGWGMIHREAACSGLPVITQAYAGLDDGYTKEWAMVVEGDYEEEIPKEVATALGVWRIANFQDIAQKMKYCFYSPETAAKFGRDASQWIRKNQTWHHSAQMLMGLLMVHGKAPMVFPQPIDGKMVVRSAQASG